MSQQTFTFMPLECIDQILKRMSWEGCLTALVCVFGIRTVGNGDYRDGSPDEGAAVGRKLEQDIVPALHRILETKKRTRYARQLRVSHEAVDCETGSRIDSNR